MLSNTSETVSGKECELRSRDGTGLKLTCAYSVLKAEAPGAYDLRFDGSAHRLLEPRHRTQRNRPLGKNKTGSFKLHAEHL